MPRFAHEKLAKLRGKATQTDLALILREQGYGTTQTTVSRWEGGQEPRAYILPALADALARLSRRHVTVDDLYDPDEEGAPFRRGRGNGRRAV